MVDSIVVVAIPAQDDYVWKISSEKVPHLTLLYLDKNLGDVNRVTGFIQHVIDTSLNKFMLQVDHRGVLGDQSADVLFFSDYYKQRLEQFRSYLLTDPDISRAYSAVEQYPTWTPHLTLGYPATPAKPDNRDREFPGIHWVDFDRIALWTGDYEGVEFPLKSPGSDVLTSDLAMSDAVRKGELILAHHGVKGQKWGVIRSKITNNPVVNYAKPSSDHLAVQKTRLKAKIVGVRALTNKDLQHVIKRMDLEVKYKDLRAVEHSHTLLGKGAKWVGKVATNILVGVAINWLKRPGFGRVHQPSDNGRVFYPSHVGRPAPHIRPSVKVIDGTIVPKAIGR